MGQVVKFPERRQVRRKTKGELYEVIVPLSVFMYGKDGEAAGMAVMKALQERLDGLQFDVDDMLIRQAHINHLKV